MIFLIAVLIGIVTGYLLGGRLSRLSSLRLRGVWLVLLAVLIQALIFPLFTDRPVIPVATEAFHLISYLLVFIWLALNISVHPLLLVGAGALCNLLVIVVNGGKMPASITAIARAGGAFAARELAENGVYGNLVAMSSSTHLNFLGDTMYLPGWIPFATAFSAGDLVIMIGLIWLMIRGMRQDA